MYWTGVFWFLISFLMYIPGYRVVFAAVFEKMYPSEMPILGTFSTKASCSMQTLYTVAEV